MIEAHSELLRAAGVRHGFGGRRGGVSVGAYATANGSPNVGDDPLAVAENRRRFVAAIGGDPKRVATLRQVHGIAVQRVEAPPAPGTAGDALVSRTPGLVLAVTTADCVPVLVVDPETGWAAAIHAGWRGAVAGIVRRTLEALRAAGVRPAACLAAIGPCIRQRSYEVDAVVRDAALAARGDAASLFLPGDSPGRWTFDLAGFVARELDESGTKLVDDVGVDTLEQNNSYFSYRRTRQQGQATYGVQLSGIVVPDRP